MARTGRQFHVEMRRRRLDLGMSLRELAEATFFSKGHLSKVENGYKRPTVELAQRIDAALTAGGDLVALILTGIPARRRPSLRAPSASGAAEKPWAIAEASGAAARMVPEIFTDRLTAMRLLGQQFGPRVVLPLAIGEYRVLAGLAAASKGADRAPVFMLASRFAEYAGWMAQEAGDNVAAMRWTWRAVALADEAGDRGLASYALVRQALVTLYEGEHRQTIALARRAAADPAAPARVRALAALREGQGHALAGERRAFENAIARAERLFDEVDDETLALGTSSLARPAAAAAGWSLYDLGRPVECAAALEGVIREIAPGAHRAYARYAARCALAHATSRNLDRACEIVATLVPLVGGLGSATVHDDLRRLHRRLGQWPTHSAVRETMPALTGALAAGRPA